MNKTLHLRKEFNTKTEAKAYLSALYDMKKEGILKYTYSSEMIIVIGAVALNVYLKEQDDKISSNK